MPGIKGMVNQVKMDRQGDNGVIKVRELSGKAAYVIYTNLVICNDALRLKEFSRGQGINFFD